MQHLWVRGCPLIEVLSKVGEQIRREERSGHLSVIPFRREVSIEVFLVGVPVQVHPARVAPNVNVAAMGNRPDQGGFSAPVLSHKKTDGRSETKASGFSKDLLVKGVVVSRGVFFGMKYYFLEMHDKIP
jgi:hypothetical protein